MRRDAEKHILQIVERLDAGEFATLDQRIEEGGPTRTVEAAGKEPILSSDRDDAELVFGTIVVDIKAAVFNEAVERLPLVMDVSERATQRRLREHGLR